MSKRGFLNVVFFVATSSGCTEQVGGMGPNDDGYEADAAESESEGEGVVICEETTYTQDEFNAAFETARRELRDEGYEVVPLTWEDEERFSELLDRMVAALDCVPESSRRAGPSSCEVVTNLAAYDSMTFYCGRGARRGIGCPRRRTYPGDCLNQVCYRHDLCYDAFLDASDGPICIWSSDTEDCDRVFHADAAVCIAQRQCGFWCMVMATIAANLDNLQNVAGVAGQECLYDADCSDGDLRSCGGSDVGACTRGAQTCQSGQWGECEGVVEPSEELCDELDNDCDGISDNGFPVGLPCDGPDGDDCLEGIYACTEDGTDVRCPDETDTLVEDCYSPSDEDCDGDEDCADDDCPDGSGCCADWGEGCEDERTCAGGACTCGNYTCSGSEDFVSCPQDCVDGSESEAESEDECVLVPLGRDCDAGNPTARAGCCCGTILRYCYETGSIDGRDCATTGDPCGWDPSIPGYNCGGSGEDPSGTYPLECTGL